MRGGWPCTISVAGAAIGTAWRKRACVSGFPCSCACATGGATAMQTVAPPNSSALLQLGGKAPLMLSLLRRNVAARGQLPAVFASFLALVAAASPGCSDNGAPDRTRPAAVPLQPVTPGVRARGEARIVGRGRAARLELRVRGLPVVDGAYEVWLFNSALDAIGLARVARGSFAIRTR